MLRPRTLLAILLSLMTAIAPGVAAASAKFCATPSEVTVCVTSDGACSSAMGNCGTMAQCRTTVGCSGHCFPTCGIAPDVIGSAATDHRDVMVAAMPHLSSLSIKPPAPPPRA